MRNIYYDRSGMVELFFNLSDEAEGFVQKFIDEKRDENWRVKALERESGDDFTVRVPYNMVQGFIDFGFRPTQSFQTSALHDHRSWQTIDGANEREEAQNKLIDSRLSRSFLLSESDYDYMWGGGAHKHDYLILKNYNTNEYGLVTPIKRSRGNITYRVGALGDSYERLFNFAMRYHEILRHYGRVKAFDI